MKYFSKNHETLNFIGIMKYGFKIVLNALKIIEVDVHEILWSIQKMARKLLKMSQNRLNCHENHRKENKIVENIEIILKLSFKLFESHKKWHENYLKCCKIRWNILEIMKKIMKSVEKVEKIMKIP